MYWTYRDGLEHTGIQEPIVLAWSPLIFVLDDLTFNYVVSGKDK
jgi:hypothetical protein